ncbi:MAG: conjugal transfer protein TraF [Paramuribaculum sp.]|nr:conjugal transfer protein TraF [Paramuribaculum sp.]
MKILKITAICTLMLAICGLAVPQQSVAQTQQKTKAVAAKAVEYVKEIKKGEKIAAKPKVLTIIDFNATWCGPCQKFKPIFHKLAKEYKGKVQFLSVDVDNCPELAQEFKVSSIPQITAIKPNGTQTTKVGYMDEATFKAFVQSQLK